MAEKMTHRLSRADQLLWKLWCQNFEQAYGKGTLVSKAWLERNFLAQRRKAEAGSPVAVNPSGQATGETLEAIRLDLGDCTRCKLSGGRKTIVFGEGNPQAELMFIGEGPGEQEDIQGRPFVGNAGQLLDKIIEAMGLKRSQVYIANVVKCRPPGNRAPEPDEVAACEPFLFRQIETIRPRIIVALGGTALKCLFHDEDIKITKVRGQFREFRGTKLMPTYHPAFLLRNPEAKKDVWEDMKKVKAELERK